MSNLSWSMLFDGWAPVIRTLLLGTLAYIALVALLRISGKRTLSRMNAFDFVVTVAFGSTLAAIMTSQRVSLVQGVQALILLVLLQAVNTWLAVRFPRYKKLLKAQPTLVFFKGQFLLDAMKAQRLTEQEILAAMRQQGIAEPNDVDAVVMETEGSLSVLARNAGSLEALEKVGMHVDESIGRKQDETDRPDAPT